MNKIAAGSDDLKQASVNDLFERFSASADGLSDTEAQQRLAENGYNEIAEKKTSPVLKLLGYFWGPIPWMIETAAILSAFIHHWEDFWIIFTLLLLNAVVGFWQEYKADRAVEKEAGAQLPGAAQREMAHAAGPRTGPR